MLVTVGGEGWRGGGLPVLGTTAPLRAVVLLNRTMRSDVEAGWKPAGVAARERVAAVARTARDLGRIMVVGALDV